MSIHWPYYCTIHWPYYCTIHVFVVINICNSMQAFCAGLFIFLHIDIGDSDIKRGGWDVIKWFNPTTLLCLSQARTWISNVICHGLFCVQWVKMKGDCSFNIGGIVDHRCLNILFIKTQVWRKKIKSLYYC